MCANYAAANVDVLNSPAYADARAYFYYTYAADL